MKAGIRKLFLSIAIAALAIVCSNTTDIYAAQKFTVTFIYGNNVNTQQVKKGGNAVVPTNTEFPGMVFAGWTDTAANIQCDKTILGMYTPTPAAITASKEPTQNKIGGRAIKANNDISAPGCDWWDYSLKGEPGKTCVVRWYNGSNGELWKTEVVPYGTTLDDPGNPCIAGYDFIGWVGSWENITEDRNIMAWYMHKYAVNYYDPTTGNKLETVWTRDYMPAGKPWLPDYLKDKYNGYYVGAPDEDQEKVLHDMNLVPDIYNYHKDK